MADRFRELERPQAGRRKDIVLIATVSSFESLARPSASDLRQFAELFEPLYLASSDEARRQAVAALSQCHVLPERTMLFIAVQPIAVAAIFLTRSHAIDDRVLAAVLRSASPDHARAIARREDLSPTIIEALVGSHQDHRSRRTGETRQEQQAASAEATRPSREDALREEIKAKARDLARQQPPPPPALVAASEMHQALLVRFARVGETGMLSAALADALSSSQWLSDRILLDLSGQQLAATLLALDIAADDAAFILSRVYRHIGNRSADILARLDRTEARERVESWQRADHYTRSGVPHLDAANAAGERNDDAGLSGRRIAG